MTTAVGYLEGGVVTILDLDGELRFEVTPAAAEDAARLCDAAAAANRPTFSILIPTVRGDAFCYEGDPAAFTLMAEHLRIAADKARMFRPQV